MIMDTGYGNAFGGCNGIVIYLYGESRVDVSPDDTVESRLLSP